MIVAILVSMTHYATQQTRNNQRPTLLIVTLIAACLGGFYLAYNANTQLTPVLPPLAANNSLQRWLLDENDQLQENNTLHHIGTVGRIYARTNYQMLWLDGFTLAPTGELLLQQLLETSADQLIDYQYHLSYIQQRLHNMQMTPRAATALDIQLTDAFISYAEDVMSNQLLPDSLRKQKLLQPVAYHPSQNSHSINHDNIIRLVSENQSRRQLNKVLHGMAPKHNDYKQLRLALIQYQELAKHWQPLSEGPTLKLGQRHPQVVELRELLSLYGDYPLHKNILLEWFADDTPLTEKQAQTLDESLAASLKQFQQRHGMQTSGKLDKQTRKHLNVPPLQRIRQIALNMKRWRELPADLGERFLWVNMTDYSLQLINHGAPELEMKVIIGKTYRKTPALKESINTLVLNPSWNVPRRIGLYDILPQARKDTAYLTSRNIRVLESWSNPVEVPIDTIDWKNATARNFKYRFQQAPGDNNALGSVKFVIPNDMSIYLHDTSHPELFARHKRALSSGCVRVEKPMQLARALLKGKKNWGNSRIDSQLESGETQYVKLPKPVPTYLAYLTAWVDKDQLIQFRDDVYQRDQIVSNTEKTAIEL